MAIPSVTKAMTSATIKTIPSCVAIPSVTMAIISAIPQCGFSICYFGNSICHHPIKWLQHLPQWPSICHKLTYLIVNNICHNLWHNICQHNYGNHICHQIKINLQLIVYIFIRHTNTNTPGCLFGKNNIFLHT